MISPELAAAAAEARPRVDAGAGDAYDHAILALAASEAGDHDLADRLFDRALALEPGNPATLTSLAVHYRRQGRQRDAVLACDAAIRSAPDYPDAWLERGAILAAGGSNAAARDSFAQAARLAPYLAAAHAGLAALDAREGDPAGARSHSSRALAIDPNNAVATNALASAELAEGDAAAALRRLETLLTRLAQASVERSLAHTLAGDCQHRLGNHPAAFRHYTAAKADFAAFNAPLAAGQLDHRSFVEALITGMATVDAVRWQPPAMLTSDDLAAQRHIFLLGYPRSGTTLVENILASLPGVAALEEWPTFAVTDQAFISGGPPEIVAGLNAYAGADAAALAPHVRGYWQRVIGGGVAPRTDCFVDMDPLKATRLPFIARMFPDARILVMRRDPRDVVWSCFRTNFAMTSGTLEYVTLERAARHYDAVMRLTELALERLPLHKHIVDYHRLVRNFDAETQALCRFVGLEWSQAVRRFDRTAIARGVATASVGQVRRGLYDGTRQWEPYAHWLDPVLPILQPWIERFGYAD